MDGLSSLFRENEAALRADREGFQGQMRETVLKDSKLEAVEKSLQAVIQSVTRREAAGDRLLLVLDGIDFLLAASDIDTQSVTDMLAELRTVRYPTPSSDVLFPIP